MRILAAQQDAFRVRLVVSCVVLFQVVVAGHVQQAGQSGGVRSARVGQRLDYGARAVEPLDIGDQAARRRNQIDAVQHLRLETVAAHGVAEGIAGILDFVADAPKYDGGVVSVAQHHIRDVAVGPLFENLVIAARAGRTGVPALNPFVLAGGPLIEGFVHHQQAQAVAQVVLLGRHGVMGAADGVDAQFLQSLQPALQGRFGKGRAEGAQVVVQTNAFELERLAVEEETVVRVEAGRADAEGRAGFVGERAGNVSARHGGVQVGLVQ